MARLAQYHQISETKQIGLVDGREAALIVGLAWLVQTFHAPQGAALVGAAVV